MFMAVFLSLPGHSLLFVMAGHSRSKNGVLSHAYVPAIHVFVDARPEGVDARNKSGHDVDRACVTSTHHTLSLLNVGDTPLPYSFKAPCSPIAFGRWKIQFCQAVRRPKILVSIVSGPAKRKFASMPVIASGEKLVRSSSITRSSSSQSKSS